jgi:hypothetical protein
MLPPGSRRWAMYVDFSFLIVGVLAALAVLTSG